jgi:hypothetical protein
MKQIALVAIGVLFFAHAAAAQPSWSSFNFATSPQNAPQVLAATDALMNSAVGKKFPGKLLLQMSTFDGANPATHSFVPIYKTVADREAFVEKMTDDPAWKVFQAEMTRLTEPVSSVLYRTVKTWGDIVDTQADGVADRQEVSRSGVPLRHRCGRDHSRDARGFRRLRQRGGNGKVGGEHA